MYNRGTYALPAFKKKKTYFELTTKEAVEEWLVEPKITTYTKGNNYKDIAKLYNLHNLSFTKKDFI